VVILRTSSTWQYVRARLGTGGRTLDERWSLLLSRYVSTEVLIVTLSVEHKLPEHHALSFLSNVL
jgi:hypothetical protein